MTTLLEAAETEVLAPWFLDLKATALWVSELAGKSAALDASAVVRSYLRNEQLRAALGASPETTDVPTPGHPFSEWTSAIWGRRCAYYLSAVARGLEGSAIVLPDQHALEAAKILKRESIKLRDQFGRERRKGDTLARSIQLGHGVTNFHRTYLDPVLFSALLALTSLDENDWAANEELGARTTVDRVSMQKELLAIIGREIDVYTEGGVAKSGLLADDSTLWWGVFELIRRTGDGFVIGIDSGTGFTGLSGAADLVVLMAQWTSDELLCPHFRMAVTEATPEIYRRWRTQMLVVQNCVSLSKVNWPAEKRNNVSHALSSVTTTLFNAAHLEWLEDAQLRAHAYFIGLGLEVASGLASLNAPAKEAIRIGNGKARGSVEIGPFESRELRTLLNVRESKWELFVMKNRWIRVENRQNLYVDVRATPLDYRQTLDDFEHARRAKAIGDTLANREKRRRVPKSK